MFLLKLERAHELEPTFEKLKDFSEKQFKFKIKCKFKSEYYFT